MRVIQGKIISLKAMQTAIVLVERKWQHPLYGKFVKRTKKFACHYLDLPLVEGDTVEIKPIKPVSKTKRFQVVRKVTAA